MKRKYSKAVAGVLSSAILLESCGSGYYMDYTADELNKVLQETSDIKESVAIPIKIQLSNENVEYIDFLRKLSVDIINNNKFAEEFIQDPAKYIEQNGFDAKFANLDLKLTKIILALADEGICSAIEAGDIKQYLKLMQEKKLIETISIKELKDINYIKDNIYSLSNMYGEIKPELTASLFFPVVVVGVAIAVWAVVAEHVFIGNAAVVGTAFYYAAAVSTKYTGNTGHQRCVYEAISSTNAIEVFSIKSKRSSNINVVADALIEETIISSLDYLKEHYPDEYAKYDENTLKNMIILNIQKTAYE